jgi:hypothetical protein
LTKNPGSAVAEKLPEIVVTSVGEPRPIDPELSFEHVEGGDCGRPQVLVRLFVVGAVCYPFTKAVPSSHRVYVLQ